MAKTIENPYLFKLNNLIFNELVKYVQQMV